MAHSLGDNELLSSDEVVSDKTRWMVFKVKQRSQTQYENQITAQVGESTKPGELFGATSISKNGTQESHTYPVQFNWPYDYVSFVESVKFEASALYQPAADETAETPVPDALADSLASDFGIDESDIQAVSELGSVSAELFNKAISKTTTNATDASTLSTSLKSPSALPSAASVVRAATITGADTTTTITSEEASTGPSTSKKGSKY